ncbi:hypothetical protein [Algoriella sp.]|uniref:hypothetical protein n=1 Tax=Algoriella sp. TaxID=1872434 RepID=UPI001B0ABA6B|nr:hypothetical protein [Algoriella sp.]MBO6213241.1 hypothetical protein [Algoriella sp.]
MKIVNSVIIVISLFFHLNCNHKLEKKKDFQNAITKKYYKGFGKYSHPILLYEEFEAKDTINTKDAYFVGYYKNGLLIRVEKKLNNKFEFGFIYRYDYNGNFIDFENIKDTIR